MGECKVHSAIASEADGAEEVLAGMVPRPAADGWDERLVSAARAIAAVSVQLDLALREAQQPATAVGEALGAIAAAGEQAGESAPSGLRVALAEQLPRCIEALQFIDRLTQHVTHLSKFLATIAEHVGQGVGEPGAAAAWTTTGLEGREWELIRRSLRVRLISDAQRELLDLLIPPLDAGEQSAQLSRSAYEPSGSVELF